MAVGTLRIAQLRAFADAAIAVGADYLVWFPVSARWHAVGGAKGKPGDVLTRVIGKAGDWRHEHKALLLGARSLAKNIPREGDHAAEVCAQRFAIEQIAGTYTVDFVIPSLERYVALTVAAVPCDAGFAEHLEGLRAEPAVYDVPLAMLQAAGVFVSSQWRHGADPQMRAESIATHLSPGEIIVRCPNGATATMWWEDARRGPSVRLWVRAAQCLGAMAAQDGARMHVSAAGRVYANAGGTAGEFGHAEVVPRSAQQQRVHAEARAGEGYRIRLWDGMEDAIAPAGAQTRIRVRAHNGGVAFTRESTGLGSANKGCVVMSTDIIAALRMARLVGGEEGINHVCIDSSATMLSTAGVVGRCRVVVPAAESRERPFAR